MTVRLVCGLALLACLAACAPRGAALPTATPSSSTSLPDAGASPDPEADPQPQADPQAGADPEADEAGLAEGDLVVYTTRSEALIKPVVAAFEQAHPEVEVALLTGQNAELSAKLLEEHANPRADVFVNSDVLSMIDLAEEGLFAPSMAESVTAVPEQYRAADGSWVGLTLRPRVIMVNTDLVKPEEAPQSVFDLTDGRWKGQVGSSGSSNGAMVAQIAAIRRAFGEARAKAFLEGLLANDTQFFLSHTDVRSAVGSGELKLGLVNHYYYFLSKAEGAPVGVVFPDQGAGQMGLVVNTTNAAIPQGAPHPEAAQVFLDYLLSPEGQELFAKLNYEYPIRPGVPLADGVPPLEQFRLADVPLREQWDELAPTRALIQQVGLP
jgi:iron(III) transport system substrate-binding protein